MFMVPLIGVWEQLAVHLKINKRSHLNAVVRRQQNVNTDCLGVSQSHWTRTQCYKPGALLVGFLTPLLEL